MIGIIIVLGAFLILFSLAFLTGKRFGFLGLGLATGVLLNQLVGGWVGDLLKSSGIPFDPFKARDIATIILTILPSFLLLGKGNKQTNLLFKLIFALIYAIIALALILLPLISAFPVKDAMMRNILTLLQDIQLPALTFGIILALVDLLRPTPKKL